MADNSRPDDDRPAETDQATGTGWAENDPTAGSLTERLAYLDSLAPVDEDGEFVVVFDDELDDEGEGGQDPAAADPGYAEPYGDQAYDQPYGDQAYDESYEPGYDAAASAAGFSVAPVATPMQPNTVPGLAPTAGGRRQRRRPSRRWGRLRLPVIALVLVTLAVGVATAFVWLDVREKQQTEGARRTGLEASRDAARELFSYDYRTLDKDFSAGRALTTGAFRTDYEKTTTKVVADVAKRYKAVVTANVINAGVVRASPNEVVTIVYVNQVTTSTQVTGEKVDLSRVRMTVVRSGGRWLVTKVDAL
ncbi:MAG: hypothetical protein ABIO67_05895 [Mycobacteriales bacterium]